MEAISRGKQTLLMESENLKYIAEHLDKSFSDAVDLLFSAKGRVITTGVGKSGHIARKAASTFASTGTPSFFVDPTDCVHGDFGMITKDDYMILYSKDGESREIVEVVNWLVRQEIAYISITNNLESTMAKYAKINLLIYIKKEACPLNLAPTVSSTASLAMSDALATALMEKRGFVEKDFAIYHPAGSLGRQLAKVSRIMHKENLPIVNPNTSLYDALFTIIEGKLGLAIVQENGFLQGIIVDGDFKRFLVKYGETQSLLKIAVKDIMNKTPLTVTSDTLVGEALSSMEGKVTSLIVVEHTKQGDKAVGVLHIHDILKSKSL